MIAQRVPKDRLVSLTEPQARHGRKSKSQTLNLFSFSSQLHHAKRVLGLKLKDPNPET